MRKSTIRLAESAECGLYYLPRDPELQQRTETLPRSTRTIWKILRRNDRISQKKQRKRKPLERPLPLEEVQMDFKDVSSVPADPAGKQQHVVEVFNFVDAGTSILLEAQVQADFHGQTALEAVIHYLQRYGLPPKITLHLSSSSTRQERVCGKIPSNVSPGVR